MHTRLTLPALVLLATGCPSTPRPAGPDINLSRFESCEDLKSYVTESTLEMLIQQSSYYSVDLAVEDSGEAGDSSGGGPSSVSGTNVQEASVDEPDMVKTDGQHIYALKYNTVSIIKSWPVEETKEIAEVDIDGNASSLFLHGDRLIVLSTDWETGWPTSEVTGYGSTSTRVTVIDVSEPSEPEVIRTSRVQGQMIGARMVGTQMVLSTRHTAAISDEIWESAWEIMDEERGWDIMYSGNETQQRLYREEMREKLRPVVTQSVMDTPTAAMLFSVEEDGEISIASGCSSIYHPDEMTSPEMVNMVHIDMGEKGPGGDMQATTIMAGGTTMYASQDNIYLAQGSFNWWWGFGDIDMSTRIHRFELKDDGTAYTSSGAVPGWLHNQFSMSEHEGRLRVATTLMDWWWGSDNDDQQAGNNVYILEPSQGQMQTIGAIEGLAPGERIYAARFQGDKGFLVTFEQVDPLFTLDLSDPTNPQAVGELKIPGYSSFLQTRGEERLVGVGMDGTDDGQITGVSVSLFDVSDFADPTQVDRVSVDSQWGSSEALWDHHAITMHGNILTVPYQGYDEDWGYEHGLLVVEITKNDVSERTRLTHQSLVVEHYCEGDPDCEEREIHAGDSQIRRAIVMDDYLFSVSSYGVMVSDLANDEDTVASVVFR